MSGRRLYDARQWRRLRGWRSWPAIQLCEVCHEVPAEPADSLALSGGLGPS